MFVVSEPRAVESVSKLVSEPGAVAMGSNNSAKLDDPVTTALGSDTVSVADRIFNTKKATNRYVDGFRITTLGRSHHALSIIVSITLKDTLLVCKLLTMRTSRQTNESLI